MAAPTIAAVMAGIEVRLKTINGLRTSPNVPDQVNPPQAVIGVPVIPNYHEAFAHGRMLIEPTVTVLVSKAYDRVGQTLLAGYANPSGASSIHAAIEGDKSLGGIVDDVIVVSFRPLGNDEVGILGFYGGVFQLRVMAQGV